MKKTWSKVLATVLVLAMVLCMPGFAASAADTVDYDADHATSAEELTDADQPELLAMTDSALQKLGKISDEEFTKLELFPDF